MSTEVVAELEKTGQEDVICNLAGITKRDYFAAAAMQGMLASDAGILSGSDENDSLALLWCHPHHHNTLSNRAYLIADAMLGERSK